MSAYFTFFILSATFSWYSPPSKSHSHTSSLFSPVCLSFPQFSLTFLAEFSVAFCNDDLGYDLRTYKFCSLPHFWWRQKFSQSQLFWPVFCPCEFISINENDKFFHGVHFIIFITRYAVTGAEIRPKLLQPRKFKQAAEFVS